MDPTSPLARKRWRNSAKKAAHINGHGTLEMLASQYVAMLSTFFAILARRPVSLPDRLVLVDGKQTFFVKKCATRGERAKSFALVALHKKICDRTFEKQGFHLPSKQIMTIRQCEKNLGRGGKSAYVCVSGFELLINVVSCYTLSFIFPYFLEVISCAYPGGDKLFLYGRIHCSPGSTLLTNSRVCTLLRFVGL